MANGGLSFGESVLTSFSGVILVFAILAVLAAATLLVARFLNRLMPSRPQQAAQSSAVPDSASTVQPELEAGCTSEVMAVLHGALSMASGISVDQMAIVSVTSIPAD